MLEPKKEKDEEVRLDTSDEVTKEEVTPVVEQELSTDTVEEKPTEETSEESKEAMDEVGNKVAEDAEKDEEKNEIPLKNYEDLDLEALTSELEKLIKNYPVQQINTHVNRIKSSFNKKFGALLTEKKEAFLAEGGNSIDFQFSSPIKTKYNSLLSDFKKTRDAYYSNLENTLNENLEKRLQVIESLKELIADADPKTMYKSFRELQNSWRNIGPVPKTRYNDTWKTYHHHVERFYDLLHLSNDFRELDFKNNLEEKIQLVKQAEELVLVEDVNVAFKELQKLHKTWKEDVGPVAREMREEVWQKFSAATKKIHDRRHEYYRGLKFQYQEVVDKKLAVIEEIDNYDFLKNNSHSDWQKSIRQVEALRQKYFEAGKLPYSKSEPIWQKFKAATKKFNQAKNAFYKEEKSAQQQNLEKKKELIKLALSFKDSEDWENTANNFKRIQADWKKIGHVPRKFSDKIWKEFKDACNYFFDRYHKERNVLTEDQQQIVEKKKAFIEKVAKTKKATKDEVLQMTKDWSELGKLPRSVRHLENKFNKAIDALLDTLKLDKDEISMIKFTNIVNSYIETKNYRRLDSEAQFVRKKIDEITKEIQQLENNLSFISVASEENPMFKNVRDRIEGFKSDLVIWQQKLDYLKKLDY